MTSAPQKCLQPSSPSAMAVTAACETLPPSTRHLAHVASVNVNLSFTDWDCATLAPGEAPAVHSDRGGHYRWPGRIAICERHGLARSMSRKGTSGDNARAEGFFGLLKQEFFHPRDWRGVGLAEFMSELDAWMRWFRSGRISQALGRLTPDEHRLAQGYAV